MSKQYREFWATQDLYKADGIYVMAEDAQYIEEIAKVETPFKVIEKQAADDLANALQRLLEDNTCHALLEEAEQALAKYRGEK